MPKGSKPYLPDRKVPFYKKSGISRSISGMSDPSEKRTAKPTSPFSGLSKAAAPEKSPAKKGLVAVINERHAKLACAGADDMDGCVARLRRQQTSDSSN